MRTLEIVLRQGSLIIDARVHMPTSAGMPVTPSGRAVTRVLRANTGITAEMNEPRVGREDMDDELWRAADNAARGAEQERDTEWPRLPPKSTQTLRATAPRQARLR